MGRGNVDDDVLLAARRCGKIRQSPKIDFELLQARRGRHVQGSNGPLIDDTCRREPVGRLEALNRLFKVKIEADRRDVAISQIARREKPAAQQ